MTWLVEIGKVHVINLFGFDEITHLFFFYLREDEAGRGAH